MNRRLPALVAALTAISAVIIVGRDTPVPAVASFTEVGAGWMPQVTDDVGLTASWFCPGVPATGEDGVGGQVLLGNRTGEPVTAQVQWLGPVDAPADAAAEAAGAVVPIETVVVEPFSILTLEAAERRQGSFVSAVVELEGGGVVVEQRAVDPAGTSVAPCANETSAEWYVADGFTVGDSRNELVLTNPYEDVVIVDIGFATAEGSRAPAVYQGLPVAPRSVLVLDLGAPGAGAQDEPQLAVRVEATRGRLVAGRSQHFVDGGRLGATMSLAAPALRDQWWFSDGEKGPGISERFSLYNPTSDDVEVDALFLGVPEIVDVEPVVVPARQVVVFDPGAVATLREGRHATVFSTQSEPSIVVERALTRTVDGRPVTSVALGATYRPSDGAVATRWHLVAGPTGPTAAALVVFNVDNVDATLSVEAVGPDGPVPVPGLEALPLPAASIRTIDIVDPAAIGRELVVTSTSRVFVERSLFSDDAGGRSASWALPAG